jgi:uncharacterized protein
MCRAPIFTDRVRNRSNTLRRQTPPAIDRKVPPMASPEPLAKTRPVALVTGASSGIGAALARELAKDGHDLVLTARRRAPMQALADEFKAIGAATTVITADLSQAGAAAELVREIEERRIPIDVLIAAAGLGDNSRFIQQPPEKVAAMLQVNIVALTEITRLLLPQMVARRHGRVMLVASTAAFQPGPEMAVYYASKAYVLSVGQAIGYELRRTGVTVTTLCPGATATEFAGAAHMEGTLLFSGLLPVLSAAEVARRGYAGLKAGRRVVIPGLVNNIMVFLSRFTPSTLLLRIARLVTRQRNATMP